jgi:hypothetical protein
MEDVILTSEDPRLQISFMSKEKIENFHLKPDLLDTNVLDYGIKVREHPKLLDEHVPMSLLSIKTLDEARIFYEDKYPHLPDEYYDIMAKYHFGEQFTKKQLKNEVKKINKGKKSKELDGLKIVRNKVLVNFD